MEPEHGISTRDGRVSHLHMVSGDLHCGDIRRGSRLLDVIHHDCILAGGDSHLGRSSHAQQGPLAAPKNTARRTVTGSGHAGASVSMEAGGAAAAASAGATAGSSTAGSPNLGASSALAASSGALPRRARAGWGAGGACMAAGGRGKRVSAWRAGLQDPRCNSHKDCTRTCVSCTGRRLVFSRRLCVAVSEDRAVSVGPAADTRGRQAGHTLVRGRLALLCVSRRQGCRAGSLSDTDTGA